METPRVSGKASQTLAEQSSLRLALGFYLPSLSCLGNPSTWVPGSPDWTEIGSSVLSRELGLSLASLNVWGVLSAVLTPAVVCGGGGTACICA